MSNASLPQGYLSVAPGLSVIWVVGRNPNMNTNNIEQRGESGPCQKASEPMIIDDIATLIINTSPFARQVYHESSPDPGQKPESANSAQNLPAHINPHHRYCVNTFWCQKNDKHQPTSQVLCQNFLVSNFELEMVPVSKISGQKLISNQNCRPGFCDLSETLLGWRNSTPACSPRFLSFVHDYNQFWKCDVNMEVINSFIT